jgi:ADP-heptose:LPS heptosyltransferase
LAVVLALRALGLGDLLTAVPALRALVAAFPRHRRVLAAPRALAPLVELLHEGWEVVDLPSWVAGEEAPRVGLARRLPAGAIAVNLHGRGPDSDLLLLASRPERLIAFAHRDVPETHGGPAWSAEEHEVARWCRLLEESGIPADPRALDVARPPAAPPQDPALTLLHPGAASEARRWPADRWATVARAERAHGRRVILSGSAAELPLARRIAAAAQLPAGAIRAGEGDLGDLAALVARAGRVVCGDTGVAHLATALRVPSVVLFGPTAPSAWGPPRDRPWHRVVWRGAVGDPHAARVDGGLARIQPQDVLAELARLP